MIYDYSDTFIGADYLRKPKFYNIDLLLEFLGGLISMRSKIFPNSNERRIYDREIEAVKEVLTMQSK